MNKFFIFSLALFLGSFTFISCSDDELLDTSSPKGIKKTETFNEGLRPYPDYEMNEYNDDRIIEIISSFSDLINNQEIIIPEYDINEAVFATETFFNVAIVDKQTIFDTTSYDKQHFVFTVTLTEGGKITAENLRTEYIRFIRNIKSTMGNKFLQFSDVYVNDISPDAITFGLDIPQFSNLIPPTQSYRKRILRNNNEFYSPQTAINDYEDWNTKWTGTVFATLAYYSQKDLYANSFLHNIKVRFFDQTQDTRINGTSIYDPTYYHTELRITGTELTSLVNNTINYSNFAAQTTDCKNMTIKEVVPICNVIYYEHPLVSKDAYVDYLIFADLTTEYIKTYYDHIAITNPQIFQ